MNKDKCKACGAAGGSCCKVNPIFTHSELAKLIFKHSELMRSLEIDMSTGTSNTIMLTKKGTNVNEKSYYNKDYCLFLDTETWECNIYDSRPRMCRDYGDSNYIPCEILDLDLAEIAKLDSEYFKERDIRLNNLMSKYINTTGSGYLLNSLFGNGRISKGSKRNNLPKVDAYMLFLRSVAAVIKIDEIFPEISRDYKYTLVQDNGLNGIRNTVHNVSDDVKSTTYKKILKSVSKLLSVLDNFNSDMKGDYRDKIINKASAIYDDIEFESTPGYNQSKVNLLFIASSLFELYRNKPPKAVVRRFNSYLKVKDLIWIRGYLYSSITNCSVSDYTSGDIKPNDLKIYTPIIKTDEQQEVNKIIYRNVLTSIKVFRSTNVKV